MVTYRKRRNDRKTSQPSVQYDELKHTHIRTHPPPPHPPPAPHTRMHAHLSLPPPPPPPQHRHTPKKRQQKREKWRRERERQRRNRIEAWTTERHNVVCHCQVTQSSGAAWTSTYVKGVFRWKNNNNNKQTKNKTEKSLKKKKKKKEEALGGGPWLHGCFIFIVELFIPSCRKSGFCPSSKHKNTRCQRKVFFFFFFFWTWILRLQRDVLAHCVWQTKSGLVTFKFTIALFNWGL